MPDIAPLIVTAAMDEGAFAWFQDLRQSHFPVHRNHVPAHLTLFHALPGQHEQAVIQALEDACRHRSAMNVQVRGPWSIGRGVAYRLSSPDLEATRANLASVFRPWLTRQDQAPFRPHITIQNKVEPTEAAQLLTTSQLEFEPFDIYVEGLLLWRYLGGPWEAIDRFDFCAP